MPDSFNLGDSQLDQLVANGSLSKGTADMLRAKNASSVADATVAPEAAAAQAPAPPASFEANYKPTFSKEQVKNMSEKQMFEANTPEFKQDQAFYSQNPNYDPTAFHPGLSLQDAVAKSKDPYAVISPSQSKDLQFYREQGLLMDGKGPAPASSPANGQPAGIATQKVDPSQLAIGKPAGPVGLGAYDPNAMMKSSGLAGAYGETRQGIMEQAKAQSQSADETAKIYGESVKAAADYDQKVKDLSDQRAQMFKSHMDSLNKMQNEAEKTAQINPNRYWENQSTGAKMASGIAIILSGIGNAVNGRGGNSAMDMINKNIDRDIDAQKQSYQNARGKIQDKQSMFSLAMGELGNEQAATLASKASALQVYGMQVQAAAAKYQSAEIQARAKMLLGENDKELAKTTMALGMQTRSLLAGRQAATGPGVEDPTLLPENMQKNAVKMPNGLFRVAASSDGAKAIGETSAKVSDYKETVNAMKQLAQGGMALPYSERAAMAKQLMSRFTFQSQGVEGLTRLSSEDIDQLHQQILDPTSARSGTAIKLLDSANEAADNKMQNLYKTYIPGYQPLHKGAALDQRK